MSNDNDLTEQDIADLKVLADEQPEAVEKALSERHTLLEVWENILGNIEAIRAEHLEPHEASRIISGWPFLKFQETPVYRELYYDLLSEMRDILTFEIATDDQCFTRTEDAADDAENNRHHYLNLLLNWNMLAQRWQMLWDAADENSHIQLAAIADAQNFVIGDKGLVAHLEQIEFPYDQSDADLIAEALETAKEGL